MSRGLSALTLAGVIGALLGGAVLLAPVSEGVPSPRPRSVPVASAAAGAGPVLDPPADPPLTRREVPTEEPPVLVPGERVRIPRLSVDLALQLGDVARDVDAGLTPTTGAFLLPGTAVPGTHGNAYIYAHARAGLFLALWNARIGDRVEVALPSGEVLAYLVTEVDPRVAPTDLRYAQPTEDERLTLQTSTGPDGTYPRFIVVATRAP